MNSSRPIRYAIGIFVAASSILSACAHVPGQDSNMVAGKDPITVRLEKVSDAGLKMFYLHCSGSALKHSLSSGGIAACSIGYELLLQRTFDGDFHALLSWSRLHSDDSSPSEFEGGELIGRELIQ